MSTDPRFSAVGVIPARFASTRFPGKVLAEIDGVPMIARVIANLRQAHTLSAIVVATDDSRIEDVAYAAGAEVVMTDPAITSGSDRVWAAVEGRTDDIVVNVQADEPLLPGSVVDDLVAHLAEYDHFDVATPVVSVPVSMASSPDMVTTAAADDGTALYFSRSTIPAGADPVWRHVGVYAYRREALRRFVGWPVQEVERYESLEQLRALAAGLRIGTVAVTVENHAVDRPEDLVVVERILRGEPADESAAPVVPGAGSVRLLVLDADGVLTDGRIAYLNDGDQLLSFDIKDGYGVVALAQSGIPTAVISGRDSPSLRLRCEELGIKLVRTNVLDKVAELNDVCAAAGVTPAEVCFVGDDDPDVAVMAACFMSAAPADASEAARRQATVVLASRGGHGAVREIADLLIAARPAPP